MAPFEWQNEKLTVFEGDRIFFGRYSVDGAMRGGDGGRGDKRCKYEHVKNTAEEVNQYHTFGREAQEARRRM